ncbi:MAG: EAL domain-containing protein [Steroidobacteraceae bacterium]
MPQTILLVHGDDAAARLVLSALRRTKDFHFEIDWVTHCAAAVQRLTRDKAMPGSKIAAVLSALSLPDSAGIATFDSLFPAAAQIPILLISAPEDEEVARLAVQRGAQDYLLNTQLDSVLLSKAVRCMIERAAISEALRHEKERVEVTLNSIGDAVIATDCHGKVTYLNVVAERLTGWTAAEAAGAAVEEVFRIVDASTREVARNPMETAVKEDRICALAPNCVLLRRDGTESAVEDSAAPIHDRSGRVTGAVMVFHDMSEARAVALRMSYLAQHDALTDLPNRIMFNDRVAQAMASADRQQGRLAVLYMDLDRFKYTNDNLGHSVGDSLLKEVATRLRHCVRTSDTVSRQGGDEFVILLPDIADIQHAETIARKLLRALREPYNLAQLQLHITASIGMAIYPDDGTDVDTLLKHADFAMYQAKESGRDNCQFYKAELNVRASERHIIEANLRLALQNNEFRLYYQPRICLATDRIVGVEALIRWCQPQRGSIAPAEFIPVAEETGLIVPIGLWVMQEACRQARAWIDAGLPPIRISVNVSAVELRAPDFLASVRAVLSRTGMRADLLELEITETFLMQNERVTDATLSALKDMGVSLALDDFGTGYSSLTYVKRLPITCLKIDRSFVSSLGQYGDADDASIVSAVINMGRSLHMSVVAEGVENAAQLAFLKEQGCPEAQGYFFSCPVQGAEIAAMLGRDLADIMPHQRVG